MSDSETILQKVRGTLNYIAVQAKANHAGFNTVAKMNAEKAIAEIDAYTRTPKPSVTSEKWYGYAGHFIGGKNCAYHLATRINGYLISTVGDYYNSEGIRTTIGAGEDAWFETYVFECSGEDKDGNPEWVNWSEIDGERYADSNAAEAGHYRYLAKYRAILTAFHVSRKE